jgi:Na+/melibiose symporter-like transporter
MAAGADQTAGVTRVPLRTRLAFGFGAVANGVNDNGLSYFLLIFYSQVIGVEAWLVGLALTLALIMDALSDPIVGSWSDSLHSKWGRRHPFMYASALPIALCWWFLWNPPVGWSNTALFFYVLALAVLVRTAITFFETPSTALTSELTEDYDERSKLLSWRFFFGWFGGNAMSVIMFAAVFPAFVTAAIPNGQFNREAYGFYGALGACVMLVAILGCALGTHDRIKTFKPSPPRTSVTLGKMFKEVVETLSNRSFGALFVAAMFGAVASGLATSLSIYLSTYFWGFTTQQISLIVMGVFISAIIGLILGPIVTRTLGKKKGAIIIGLIAFLGAPAPVAARLFGLLPPGSEPLTFWIVFTAGVIDVGLIICFQILTTSMLADLVEEADLRTGRRADGLFFAAATFIRKLVTGLGVVAATVVLTLAGVAANAKPEDVSPESLWRLGALYVPVILTLWMAMIAALSFYKLDRAGHEANLARLKERDSGRQG